MQILTPAEATWDKAVPGTQHPTSDVIPESSGLPPPVCVSRHQDFQQNAPLLAEPVWRERQ